MKPSRKKFLQTAALILPLPLLVIGVFVTYWSTFGHTFLYNWDDQVYVLNNEAVKGFSLAHLRTAFSSYFVGNYAPMQIVSYMLDYELWGMKASGFIGTNIVTHALNGILFYLLIKRLCGERVIAYGAAFIFLFHPVQVETVAWISQRKNLLAMFFFLLAFLCYSRYREKRDRVSYFFSVAAFTLALLSKAVVVIFPMAALLFDFCFAEKDKGGWLKDKILYLVASAAVGCLALISHAPVLHQPSGIRKYPGGGLLTTFYTMLPVLSSYLRDCLFPRDLSPYYITPIRTLPDLAFLLSLLLLFLLIILGVALFRANRKFFFFYALFFIGLLPVSQVVPIITLKNDRYLYFPMLGFAPLIVSAIVAAMRRFPRWQPLTLIFSLSLFCYLPVCAYRQARIWENPITLWTYAVQRDPDNQVGWQMLALAYTRQGNGAAAMAAVDRMRQLRHEYGPVRGWE